MGFFGKKNKEARPPAASAPAAPKAAAKTTKKEMIQELTYFGKNLKVKGNVSGVGGLIIMGAFEGQFDLKGRLEVAQGARIKGDIKATDIYVNGDVEGTITATEKIHLDHTARIRGGIATPRLSVLEGATFDGKLQMSKRTTPAPKPPAPGPKPASAGTAASPKEETEL